MISERRVKRERHSKATRRPRKSGISKPVVWGTRGLSRGIKRDKLNGTNRAEFAVFSQIFADFCRFSVFLGITALRRRRFSQKTENKFMFLGSQASGHQALSAFLKEETQALSGTVRHFQAKSGTFRRNPAKSGRIRGMIRMICQDFTCFSMISHDPLGAQEPRSISTDGKTLGKFYAYS